MSCDFLRMLTGPGPKCHQTDFLGGAAGNETTDSLRLLLAYPGQLDIGEDKAVAHSRPSTVCKAARNLAIGVFNE